MTEIFLLINHICWGIQTADFKFRNSDIADAYINIERQDLSHIIINKSHNNDYTVRYYHNSNHTSLLFTISVLMKICIYIYSYTLNFIHIQTYT